MTAILSSDIVSFSSIMESDEEGTIRKIRGLRTKIDQEKLLVCMVRYERKPWIGKPDRAVALNSCLNTDFPRSLRDTTGP
jgi:hypothetical protein